MELSVYFYSILFFCCAGFSFVVNGMEMRGNRRYQLSTDGSRQIFLASSAPMIVNELKFLQEREKEKMAVGEESFLLYDLCLKSRHPDSPIPLDSVRELYKLGFMNSNGKIDGFVREVILSATPFFLELCQTHDMPIRDIRRHSCPF